MTPRLGVFSQPPDRKWADLGVTRYVRAERALDAQNRPTVSLAQWDAGVRSAGGRMIRQANWDAGLRLDAQTDGLDGWLHEQDEPDNAAVAAQDALNAAAEEAVYRKLETDYAAMKAAAPGMPVYVTISLWQALWTRPKPVNYPRIFAACDGVYGDYYFVQLGETIEKYKERIAWLRTAAPNKILGSFVNCSFLNENSFYHPTDRNPRPDEVVAQLNADLMAGMDSILFPQCFNPFQYDGMTPDNKAAVKGWAKPAPPARDPLTIIVASPGYQSMPVVLQPM
jgi:hypothetical protein